MNPRREHQKLFEDARDYLAKFFGAENRGIIVYPRKRSGCIRIVVFRIRSMEDDIAHVIKKLDSEGWKWSNPEWGRSAYEKHGHRRIRNIFLVEMKPLSPEQEQVLHAA